MNESEMFELLKKAKLTQQEKELLVILTLAIGVENKFKYDKQAIAQTLNVSNQQVKLILMTLFKKQYLKSLPKGKKKITHFIINDWIKKNN